MSKANQRIQLLEHDLIRINMSNADFDDDEDDDLGEGAGIKAEIDELKKANEARQAKLDQYEKNKLWNVDNMCHVAEERTIVGKSDTHYTRDGFVAPSIEPVKREPASEIKTTEPVVKEVVSKKKEASNVKKADSAPKASAKEPAKQGPTVGVGAFDTYHEFTVKHADLVEEFMTIRDLQKCKDFLLQHGDIILQENASNYLLLASLEDEMNGYREKMRLTARQSQIISNIAELAKSLHTHPGNVIVPFFTRMEQKELYEGFLAGVEDFVQKIITRAVVKRQEMDAARAMENEEAQGEGVDLESIPREERLGPGGLDPLEVIETLPKEMVEAFQSRDVEQLKAALLKLDPEAAERHMKRCIDSGLWVA
jgi:cell division cycle protein 37